MMNDKASAFLALFCSVIVVLSAVNLAYGSVEAPSIAWSQTYPDFRGYGRWILQTNDGGYLLLCGDSYISDGYFSLLKTDSAGKIQWKQHYALIISGYNKNVIQTSDDGYAMVVANYKTFYLVKLDAAGNQQWNKSYSDLGECVGHSVMQTQEGGYVLVGIQTLQTEPYELTRTWLLKTNQTGNVEWNQTLSDPPKSIIQTSDGSYVIAKNYDFNLTKLDSEGALNWSKIYVEQDMNGLSSGVQTSDGGFALAGFMWLRFEGGAKYRALVKTDAEGVKQWVQYYEKGVIDSMIKTADDGFVFVQANGLVKVDANGAEQWQTDIGGNIIQTTDGGYALVGTEKVNGTPCVNLTKLNRDPTLPAATPTPTEAPTSSPQNDPTPLLSMQTGLAIIAAVVVVAVAAIVLLWRHTHR
ncbi:MAG: hypothetical protein NWE92_02790 [Candidatus Bathyarchaeota archaeon]|nr:hypothetical protein [Candidatus Bathyarchaeota archaeon]